MALLPSKKQRFYLFLQMIYLYPQLCSCYYLLHVEPQDTRIRAREHHVTQKKPRKGIWCRADNFNLGTGSLRWSTACKHDHQAHSSASITCEDGKHHQTAWSAAELRWIQNPAFCALIDGRGGWTQMAKGLPWSSWCDLSGSCLKKPAQGRKEGGKEGKK